MTEEDFANWADGFRLLPNETLAGVLATYAEVAARTDELVATLPDLNASQPLPTAPWFEPGARWSARRALMHIVAETAQHSGHACSSPNACSIDTCGYTSLKPFRSVARRLQVRVSRHRSRLRRIAQAELPDTHGRYVPPLSFQRTARPREGMRCRGGRCECLVRGRTVHSLAV